MKVNDPFDRTELAYAIEALCIEARANDVEEYEIQEVLENTAKAIENDRL